MHGQGFSHDRPHPGAMQGGPMPGMDRRNAAVFLAYHNSGQRSADQITREQAGCDVQGGPQLHNLLNFFEAVSARAGRLQWHKAVRPTL